AGGGGAAGAAPDLRLLDRDRGRLPRLLPRLPGGRGRGRGGGSLAAGALPGDEADDRRRAGPAGDLRARADVMLRRRARLPVLAEIAGPAEGSRAWSLRRGGFARLEHG